MKKLTGLFFALAAAFMLTVPALAAEGEAPRCDVPDLDGAPAAVSAAPDSAEPTPVPVEDVPVDESTYHEEEPAPYTPVQWIPGRGEIADILSYWEENGYPTDVSYACNVGGEVTEDGTMYDYWEIGLVDADEGRRQEILDLVSPNCLVEFQNCLFNHAEKQAAYDKLTELAAGDPNIVDVIFIRNGDTVLVSVPEDMVKDYAQYLIRDLGLGAVVSVTDRNSIGRLENDLTAGVDIPGGTAGAETGGALVQTTPQLDPAIGGDVQSAPIVPAGETGLLPVPAKRASTVFWVCLALAVAAACTLTVLALRRRSAPAAVTVHGEIHTAGAPLTRAQTEQLVRESEETPPEGTLQAIVEKGRE